VGGDVSFSSLITYFPVTVLMKNGKELNLLPYPPLTNDQEAVFIVQQLKHGLKITDRPVEGE
jgi:hypothetical protein